MWQVIITKRALTSCWILFFCVQYKWDFLHRENPQICLLSFFVIVCFVSPDFWVTSEGGLLVLCDWLPTPKSQDRVQKEAALVVRAEEQQWFPEDTIFPLLSLLFKSYIHSLTYISVCTCGRVAVDAPWNLQGFDVQVPRICKDSASSVPFEFPCMGIWVTSSRLFHRDKIIWITEGDKSVIKCAWEEGRLHLCTE